MSLDIVPLQEAQIRTAADLLAHAFFDDPLSRFILPDDDQRRSVTPVYFVATLAFIRAQGRVDTTPDLAGVACWLPPVEAETPAVPPTPYAVDAFAGLYGETAMERFSMITAFYADLRARAMPAPHWFLTYLGVDPPRQRQGIGGRLLQPVLREADAAALPCYLETEKAANVPFYQRHGFEVLVEDDLPAGGPPFWTMQRLHQQA